MGATRGSSRTEKKPSILETINENDINETTEDHDDEAGRGHETSQKLKSGTPEKEVQVQQTPVEPESESDIIMIETHTNTANNTNNSIRTRGRAKSSSANTRTRVSAKATRKKRDELAQESLRESVQQLINLAKYEIEIDPYRGIFDDRSEDEENPKPFSSCSNIFMDTSSGDIDMSMSSSCHDSHGMNQMILDTIQCPCVKSWLGGEIEKQEAAALKAKKAKRRRSINGKKQKSKSKKQKKTETTSVDDQDIILLDEGNENGTTVVKNDGHTVPNDKSGPCDSGEDDSSGIEQQSLSFVKVKRKTKSGFICACDFNPFCLFSMGGVIDEYLNGMIREHCKSVKIEACSSGKANDGVTVLMDTDTNATSVDTDAFDRTSSSGIANGPIQAGSTNSGHDDDVNMVDITASEDLNIAGPTEKPAGSNDDDMMDTDGKNATFESRHKPSTIKSRHSHVVGEMLKQDSVIPESDTNTSTGIDMNLRKFINVDNQRISNYLESVGISEGESDKYLSIVQKWHQDMAYDKGDSNIREGKEINGDKMFAFCRPVGMRNLGATCYLNSQLQCLVANLEFIQGVFRWAKDSSDLGPAHTSNQMTLVLSQMQTLLARMIYGPETVVCTDDFSKALCLENNEMQDPNEFAR